MARTQLVLDPAADLPPDPRDPMTDLPAARLRELSETAGEVFDTALTKRQAARRIAFLAERLA